MTDWSSVDGNPAPGDVPRIRIKARMFTNIADVADECALEIRQLKSGCFGWRGEAADAFQDHLEGDLPKDLGKLSDSYERVGRGLSTYAGTLDPLQDEARVKLHVAIEARDAQLVAARIAAQRQAIVNEIQRAVNAARAKTAATRAELGKPVLYLPGQEALLHATQQQYVTEQAMQGAREADLLEAKNSHAQVQNAQHGARTRLQQARDDVAKLRDERDSAVTLLCHTIDEAEKHRVKIGLFDKMMKMVSDHVTPRRLAVIGNLLDSLGSTLGSAAMLVSIAAVFVPVLAPLALGLTAAATAVTIAHLGVSLLRVELARGADRDDAINDRNADLVNVALSFAPKFLSSGAAKAISGGKVAAAVRNASAGFVDDALRRGTKVVRAPIPALMKRAVGRNVLKATPMLSPVLIPVERATVRSIQWPTWGPVLTSSTQTERIENAWKSVGGKAIDRVSNLSAAAIDHFTGDDSQTISSAELVCRK